MRNVMFRNHRSARRSAKLLCAGLLACPAVLRANTTYTWDGSTTSGLGTFAQTDNWVGNIAPPASGTSDLVFGSLNAHGYQPTMNGSYNISSFSFNSSAISFAGGTAITGSALSIGAGGMNDAASNPESIISPIILTTSQPWNASAGSFTATNTLNLSTFALTANTSSAAATITLGGALSGTGSASLTKTGAGTLNLSGSGSAIPSLTLQGGTTQISSGSLSVGGLTQVQSPAVLNISGGSFSTGGGLSGTGGSINLTDPTGGTALTIYDVGVVGFSTTANISGTGSVQKNGSGYEGLLGTNTFTGLVLVNAGTLEMASGKASLYSAAGGTIILDSPVSNAYATTGGGGILTGAGTFSNVFMNAGGTFAPGSSYTGASQNGSGGVITITPLSTVSTNAFLTLNVPATVNLTNSTDKLTLAGGIYGSSSSLTTTGPGTLVLSGLGNISTLTSLSIQAGATQISTGLLPLTASSAPLLVQGGANLTISNAATVATTSSTATLSMVDGPVGTSITVNGSTLDAYNLTVGNASQGSLTVTSSSVLSLNQNLIIGSANGSTGMFALSGGSSASVSDGIVAKSAGSSGSVTVDGSGSVWTITGPGGLMIGGSSASTPGSVSITNAGSVSVNTSVTFTGPNSSMCINGGTLTAGNLKSTGAGYGSISLTDPTGGYALTLNSGSNGLFTYSGQISGTGSIYKSGASNQILSGTNTFTGAVFVAGGSLNMSSGAAYYYQVDGGSLVLGFAGLGTSAVYSGLGTTVTFGGPTVSGGYLEGPGTYNLSSVSTVSGTTIENGTTINPANGTYLRALTSYGTIIDPPSSLLLWYGGSNAGGNFNVSGTADLTEWTSTGVVQVNAGGVINAQFGTNMVLGGGSRTYVGTSSAPGGTIVLTSGATIELNGGLLANFGTISGGTVDVNYAGLATGTGSFSSVTVNPGGTYLPGNYGSGSPPPNLGSPFASIQPATSGATTTSASVTVNAGAMITVNTGDTLSLAGGINASGQSVTKLGGGTLAVAPFSATGLNVSGGILKLSPSALVLTISTLKVGASSTLDLSSDAADIGAGSLSATYRAGPAGIRRWNVEWIRLEQQRRRGGPETPKRHRCDPKQSERISRFQCVSSVRWHNAGGQRYPCCLHLLRRRQS